MGVFPPDANFVRVKVGQLSDYIEGEVLRIRTGSKNLRHVAKLLTAFNREFQPRTSNRV